jgi:predicted nucleic-acid-binding Zn-ribbon protein
MVMKQCPKCKSNNIGGGKIFSSPKSTILTFRSVKNNGHVPTTPILNSWVCLNCGYLEIYAEKFQLEKLKQKLSE